MKSAAVFLALVATASAFNAPMMATRAVGKAAPAVSVRWTSGFRATMFREAGQDGVEEMCCCPWLDMGTLPLTTIESWARHAGH